MSTIKKIRKYLLNCFWLILPVIIFNIIAVKFLPQYYLVDIEHPIVIIETILRIFTVLLPFVMVMDFSSKASKIGIIIYLAGFFIYACSYFIAINHSHTFFGSNIIVVLAPYWTSIIWLIGIGLIGTKLFINLRYHYSLYFFISIAFVIVHCYHGYLCYIKEI